MAERQHKYHGMPKSLFPQIRAQIAEREAALKVAIKQQEDLKITFEEKQNAALGEIEKSIETKETENFNNYLKTIVKQINQIENLVNEFSDFARMPKPVFKKINLKELISRSLNLHKLSETKIKFDLMYVH